MKILRTDIPDVALIETTVFTDDRGYFFESYHLSKFRQAGLDVSIVQLNQSGSHQKVLRGLHYQLRQPQGKLVRVLEGEIFDVAVDIRRSSQTFGRWVSATLSAQNRRHIWIPPGFAHGLYVTSPFAQVLYAATEAYAPEWERTILWSDPELAIPWPLLNGESPVVSQKDAQGKLLKNAEVYES